MSEKVQQIKDKIQKAAKGAVNRFKGLNKKARIGIVGACAVVVVAAGIFALSPSPRGEWYANELIRGVTLNIDGTANVGYLHDPDSPDMYNLVLTESARWEQKGNLIDITYTPDSPYAKEGREYGVHLIYGKDSDGDEFLKNVRTGEMLYRSGSIYAGK